MTRQRYSALGLGLRPLLVVMQHSELRTSHETHVAFLRPLDDEHGLVVDHVFFPVLSPALVFPYRVFQ
jgi:hypothetical protein